MAERATRDNNTRRSQRVRLYAPLHAEVDSAKVSVVDVSQNGLRIEHPFTLPVGHEVAVTIRFEASLVEFRALVVRCRLDRSVHRDAIVYHSGLDFIDPPAASLDTLLQVLRAVASFDLEARKVYSKKPRR